MQITANELIKLPADKPAYLIHGGEILQTTESADAVRTALKKQGFIERKVLVIKANFNWEQLSMAAAELSLFSTKLLIELKFEDDKIGASGSKAIIEFLGKQNPAVRLLIIANKLDSAVQKSKWFTAISQTGCIILAKPIVIEQFNSWLMARIKKNNFTANQDIIALLAKLYYGNLQAVSQLLEKLALCLPSGEISLADITPHLNNNADFNVFNLIDAAINLDRDTICRIFTKLQQEHTEPILILWGLAREIRTLIKIAFALQQGQNYQDICKEHGIWSSRANKIRSYLNKTALAELENILQQLSAIDLAIKGIQPGLVWQLLLAAYLQFANPATSNIDR